MIVIHKPARLEHHCLVLGDTPASCGRLRRRAARWRGVVACAIVLLAPLVHASASSHGPWYYRPVTHRQPSLIKTDVAVYGGTPGGVAAVVQAARMGRKAVLLSFNRHVGGATSGGLTATDTGNPKAIGGLALEFYDRLGKMRGFRPSEAESLFVALLKEAGVRVLLERPLESVRTRHGSLVSATMQTGETIEASVFVDASYEGDLMAAAKVSYRVGRESIQTHDEALAGAWSDVRWSGVYNFCGSIDPFVKPGDPPSGLLPEISSEKPGRRGDGDSKVQAYNFRTFLTDGPGRSAYPRPEGYDARRYGLLARFLSSPRVTWKLDYTTAPMEDGPIQVRAGDCNNAGSFSTDYVGGNYLWPDGVYEAGSTSASAPVRRGLPVPLAKLYALRERIFQDHVNYQQGLMFFLANDAGVPAELQARINRFGLDPREFAETACWPHQLYVREARRMVAAYVMTQHDCQSKRVANDPVGLASYPIDSHFCQRVVVPGNSGQSARNEGWLAGSCPRPYPVSYRAIVPKRSECRNLLVPVCLSASHVAYGSIRMEPVFMILGQSAGTAAVHAIEEKAAVQEIDYTRLKTRLLADHQQLQWPLATAQAR